MSAVRGLHVARRRLTRHTLAGPPAIVGRGRMLSLLLMSAIAMFSYATNHPDWLEMPDSPIPSALASQVTYPGLSLPEQQIIAAHGGLLEDNRTPHLRRVGTALANRASHIPQGTIRFYLLRDAQRAASYALADGSIVVTAAAFDQAQNEPALAALLSQRISEFVFQGYDRQQYPQVAQYAGQLLSATGYDVRLLTRPATPTRVANVANGGNGLGRR